MATINYLVRGDKNPSGIYLRFINSKSTDVSVPLNLFINPKFWDTKNQKIKGVIEVANRDLINSNLAKLKIFIFDEFNKDFCNGEIINKFWVEEKIKTFFNRPKFEKAKVNLDYQIYLSDFSDFWLKEKAKNWKVSSSKMLDLKTIAHYKIANDLFKKFECKKKVPLKSIDNSVMDDFSSFLTDLRYTEITVKRMIGRIKFFCNRAEQLSFEVNPNYKQIVFVQKQEIQYKEPYLNEDEINAIFKHDFKYNETLDNARDNFIIGLRTGLRISDFNNHLDVSNFKNGFIEIQTQKTNTKVAIPVHHQIKAILNKRNDSLPRKISDQKFNLYIKIICQILEFDNEMTGGISKVDEKTKIKRKVIGSYKKYELVTSHICRRSFATNHFGKIPNKVLMDVCGWSNEQQMVSYNKSTNLESAKILQTYWNNEKNL